MAQPGKVSASGMKTVPRPRVIHFSYWLRLSVAYPCALRPEDTRPKAMLAGSFIGPEALNDPAPDPASEGDRARATDGCHIGWISFVNSMTEWNRGV